MEFQQTTDTASTNSGDLEVTPGNLQPRIIVVEEGDSAEFVEYDMTWRIENRRAAGQCLNAYDLWFQMRLFEVEGSEFTVDDLFIYATANGMLQTTNGGQTTFAQTRTAVTPTGSSYMFHKSDNAIAANEGWGSDPLVGGVDRPIIGDGPFAMNLRVKESVTFQFRPIERLPVEITKCGGNFVSAIGHDGTAFIESEVVEA